MPKIVSLATPQDGMSVAESGALFDQIEKFAGYGFNKSHATTYTLIAFQAAYLKAHYLVEFYAASMGIADEDKLTLIAKQAGTDGLRVIPPDINVSTSQFEPLNDVIIAAPLSAVKNISQKGADAIMHARLNPLVVETTTGRGSKKVTVQTTYGPGPFLSMDDFKQRVSGRAVNSRGIDHLDRVGAFARIEPGQRPSTCSTRQRDQIELMPAISDQGVIANRTVAGDEVTGMAIEDVMERMFEELGKTAVPINFLSDKPKFMVILDAPFNDYEDIPKPFSFVQFVAPSLKASGLSPEDAVWTWLLRRPKLKGETHLPAAEITKSLPYLLDEIAVTRPPVIILLGNAVVKSLFPDIKSPSDEIGKQYFRADFDATVIVGFNPTQIYHDDDKRDILTGVFETAKKLIENNC